jgi:hypothetical protein
MQFSNLRNDIRVMIFCGLKLLDSTYNAALHPLPSEVILEKYPGSTHGCFVQDIK